jgi:hypothetical protein
LQLFEPEESAHRLLDAFRYVILKDQAFDFRAASIQTAR